MRIDGYHGGPIYRRNFALYIAIGPGAREVAGTYAEARGPVAQLQRVSYLPSRPLTLTTGEQVRQLWRRAGALAPDIPFYHHAQDCSQRRLATWAVQHGYDAILATPPAFDGEAGYEWAAGTFGEPQAVLLDPPRAQITTDHPNASPRHPGPLHP